MFFPYIDVFLAGNILILYSLKTESSLLIKKKAACDSTANALNLEGHLF